MAIWGAPLNDDDHAVHGVGAALAAATRVREEGRLAVARGERRYFVKIGLNSGPAVIGNVLAGLGIEAAPVLEAAQSEANKAALRTQTEEAGRLGLFGAPSFVTADGELFWGNDRLEQALTWTRR